MSTAAAPRGALAVLAATQLLLIMDTAIVNVALPSVGAELGADRAGLSWVANAYLITFGGLLLLGGRTADLLGHRRVQLTGLGLLAAASAAGALAAHPAALIAARAAQGTGAALAGAAAFALLLALFPDGPARHRALGVFAATGGLGGVLGTTLGGTLTGLLGWRATFWLNAACALLLAALATLVLRRTAAPTSVAPKSGARAFDQPADAEPAAGVRDMAHRPAARFDLGGAVTGTLGLGLLAYALVGTGAHGWTGLPTLLAGGLGAALLGLFALVERRAAAPLVPPEVLRRRAPRRANLLAGLAQTTLFPMFFLVSLYLQQVLHHSPLGGGLGLLPLSLVVVAVAPQTGRLIFRLGLTRAMTAGFALLAVGTGWLGLALTADGGFAGTVLAPSLLLGAALPLVTVTTNVAATADATPEETGLASGLVNTSQQFGSVLGLAVLVAVATAVTGTTGTPTPAAETGGYRVALLCGAAVAAVAALLAARLRMPAPVTAPPRRERVGGPH
ncbi:MFS transporter [Streptomyces sp. NPDC090025]|uniref:MFS transporter n=1 Tax=Streptomyces sp. NPDC090025 TaxID=3365922 RepID=UPI0038359D50